MLQLERTTTVYMFSFLYVKEQRPFLCKPQSYKQKTDNGTWFCSDLFDSFWFDFWLSYPTTYYTPHAMQTLQVCKSLHIAFLQLDNDFI